MEYNLEKILKIKQHISKINSDEKPPIILLYKEDHGGLNSLSLTDTALNINERTYDGEIFYICSNDKYESLKTVKLKDSYYICETLEDVETIASFIVENYLTIYKY